MVFIHNISHPITISKVYWNMEKKKYAAPVLRDIALCSEWSFLASGHGEDATPGDGLWDNES